MNLIPTIAFAIALLVVVGVLWNQERKLRKEINAKVKKLQDEHERRNL